MREPSLLEILSEADEDRISSLLELVPPETETTSPPCEGAILATVREGLGTRFHLGEALVSSCRVSIDGVEGWAMVLGGDPRRAVVGAAHEALSRARPDSVELAAMNAILDQIRCDLVVRREEQACLAASTRVEFDLLPGA
jgi:phosphonate C-P lyase system protein PhnG